MFRCSLIIVLLGLTPLALGYSSGAPATPRVCSSLTPGHGVSAQKGVSPFQLQSPTTVEPGSTVTLTLKSGGNNNFKGFLVRAYKETDEISVGQFLKHPNVKLLTCDNTDDAATHTSASEKNQVVLVWKAPDYSSSTLVAFKSTVVVNYPTFYFNNITYVEVCNSSTCRQT